MLESEAKNKICPIITTNITPFRTVFCRGSNCMAWEEWTEPTYKEGRSIPDGRKPKEPPEGHCGMIPPELNCNCG